MASVGSPITGSGRSPTSMSRGPRKMAARTATWPLARCLNASSRGILTDPMPTKPSPPSVRESTLIGGTGRTSLAAGRATQDSGVSAVSSPAPSDPSPRPAAGRGEGDEISPVELIFDLAFVFAVSQLSRHLRQEVNWRRAGETAVLLAAVFSVSADTTFEATLIPGEAPPHPMGPARRDVGWPVHECCHQPCLPEQAGGGSHGRAAATADLAPGRLHGVPRRDLPGRRAAGPRMPTQTSSTSTRPTGTT
jgi:hypothetical protein